MQYYTVYCGVYSFAYCRAYRVVLKFQNTHLASCVYLLFKKHNNSKKRGQREKNDQNRGVYATGINSNPPSLSQNKLYCTL